MHRNSSNAASHQTGDYPTSYQQNQNPSYNVRQIPGANRNTEYNRQNSNQNPNYRHDNNVYNNPNQTQERVSQPHLGREYYNQYNLNQNRPINRQSHPNTYDNPYYLKYPQQDPNYNMGQNNPRPQQRNRDVEMDYMPASSNDNQPEYIEVVPTIDNNVQPVEHPQTPRMYEKRTFSKHRNVNSGDQLERRATPNALQERTGWVHTARATQKKIPLFEQHADLIVSKMEEDSQLMDDSPIGEQLRREALRDMPQCLTTKRKIKDKLSKTINRKAKHKSIGMFKRMKYSISLTASKFRNGFSDLQYTFELWYSTLKEIEGKFGSGVATHFKFFRWLFILNILLSIPCISFVILPNLIDQHLSTNGTELFTNNGSFSVGDIFTGEGYFEHTILYYGFYSNSTITVIPSLSYHMPPAYFFTIFFLFIICFVILSVSMARSYRKNFIETKGGVENAFAHKIFCGWDFGIANQDASQLKHSTIYNELKELLDDTNRKTYKTPLVVKFWNRGIQMSMHIITIILYFCIGYGLWYLLETYKNDSGDVVNVSIVTALLINLTMIIFPYIFTFFMRFEGYKSPRTALYITLFRIFLLGVTVIGVLLMFWMSKSTEEKCWETSFGQEIYRLVIFDFIFSVLFVALIVFVRGTLQRYVWPKIGNSEFNIAYYTMQLIYNQSLFWVGLFFSPLLCVIVSCKLFITWHIRSRTLLNFSKPSSKSWRAAQTHTWFLIFTFLSLLLVLAILGYIIAKTETSSCGPFKNYTFLHDIIQDILQIDNEHIIWKLLSYLLKPGVVFLILLAMCMGVYYLRAKSVSQINMVLVLRDMIVMEGRDKEFILKHISRVTKGKWQYNLFENRGASFDPRRILPDENLSPTRRNSINFYGDTVCDGESSHSLLHSSSNSSVPQSYETNQSSRRKWD